MTVRIFTLILLLFAPAGAIADSSQVIAERAMRAWNAGDASVLYELAHPELVSRMRTSRILNHHLQDDSREIDIEAVPDWRVVTLFCEAIRTYIPPKDARYKYAEVFIESESFGDLTVVRFHQTIALREDFDQAEPSVTEVVLKREGDELLFLWNQSALINIDFTWDPRPQSISHEEHA